MEENMTIKFYLKSLKGKDSIAISKEDDKNVFGYFLKSKKEFKISKDELMYRLLDRSVDISASESFGN